MGFQLEGNKPLNSQTSQSGTRLQSPGASSNTGEISQLTNSALLASFLAKEKLASFLAKEKEQLRKLKKERLLKLEVY